MSGPAAEQRNGPQAGQCEIAVVGAGVSGLAVAWHLHRAGVDVRLIEAQAHVGGAVETELRDGFLLEKGPFNIMVRDPAFEEALTALEDELTVVRASDQAKNRYIYRRGEIHAVPTGPLAFLRTPLLSLPARLRAIRGLLLSARGRRDETTLEEFAARRFGQEVADSIVSAAIAGILAGDIKKLSAYAAFPVLRDFDRNSLSPLGRTLRRVPNMLRKSRDPQKRKWKGLVSLDRGLGGMCAALAAPLGAQVWTQTRCTQLTRDADGWTLSLARDGDAATLRAQRVILATPALAAAELLAPLAPDASETLRTIDSASLTVLNLGFRKSDVSHPLDGFGFLVPSSEPDFPLMGVLFADSAFPHHAPEGYRLLRAFIGGSRTPDVIDRSADELLAITLPALRNVLGVSGAPTLVDVCPYPNAIPQYYLDHPDKVRRIRESVAPLSGLHLAGNYLEGVSINDCIKHAKRVAQETLAARQPT